MGTLVLTGHPRPLLPSLLLPVVDAGPTPTVARPNPGAGGSSFAFPPVANGNGSSGGGGGGAEEKEVPGEDDEVRKGALEFMTTLSEARPGMLRGVEGWVNIVVRGCLEGMGGIPEDDTETWLDADVGLAFLRHCSAFPALTTL